jgi:hypothetical protein
MAWTTLLSVAVKYSYSIGIQKHPSQKNLTLKPLLQKTTGI